MEDRVQHKNSKSTQKKLKCPMNIEAAESWTDGKLKL